MPYDFYKGPIHIEFYIDWMTDILHCYELFQALFLTTVKFLEKSLMFRAVVLY